MCCSAGPCMYSTGLLVHQLNVLFCRAVYVFHWSPRAPVRCDVEDTSSSQHVFLPSWYTGDVTVRRRDETQACSR